MTKIQSRLSQAFLALVLLTQSLSPSQAQELVDPTNRQGDSQPSEPSISHEQRVQVDEAIERALQWLAANQQPNGSLPTMPAGQPAVTSLGVLAFLSTGQSLEGGTYADELRRAVDYTLDCQQPGGLISKLPTRPKTVRHNGSHTAYYNHGIAGLMLAEVYGMTNARQSTRIEAALPPAIEVLRKGQQNKRNAVDQGGWQYFTYHSDVDSDMSSTTWQLMFLRSAKNAGFDVPEAMVTDALGFVERCYDEDLGVFQYGISGSERYTTTGAAAGGIISLSMCGEHETAMAHSAGRWLIKQPVERYNWPIDPGGNYHYGTYYISHAAYQLGGVYWQKLYPRIVQALLANQRADGSWHPERGIASGYGRSYTTALAVLALTPPYQLLPIYQR